MVSIAAFQTVDPGSIPGRRIFFTADSILVVIGTKLIAKKKFVNNLLINILRHIFSYQITSILFFLDILL